MAASGFYSSPEWLSLRKQALRRDGYCCVKCGTSLRGKGRSRVDHIYPVKERPDLKLCLENLQSLCPKCDNQKHSEKAAKVAKKPVNAEGYPEDWQ